MHEALRDRLIATCRKRTSEGDCPTDPAPSGELLEQALVSAADEITCLSSDISIVREQITQTLAERDALSQEVARLRELETQWMRMLWWVCDYFGEWRVVRIPASIQQRYPGDPNATLAWTKDPATGDIELTGVVRAASLAKAK